MASLTHVVLCVAFSSLLLLFLRRPSSSSSSSLSSLVFNARDDQLGKVYTLQENYKAAIDVYLEGTLTVCTG